MPLVVFRSRLRPEHADEFLALADEMLGLAQAMPGFVSYKSFVADDGERCSIIEFDTDEHLRAWQQHPEHADAMRIGRERFYEEYSLRVGDPARKSDFVR
jgi:heme-degrading monooxygenase HmoA